jgi:hypothetical protein
MARFYIKSILLIAGSFLCLTAFSAEIKTSLPISGHSPTDTQQIISSDVLARVVMLREELNLIRKAMGKPREAKSLVAVTGASPREAYFQAEVLFQKANRLAYEVTGSLAVSPKLQGGERLLPAQVWQLVDASLKRVLLVKKVLQIHQKVKEVREPKNKTSTDVFNAILQVNHELNELLFRRLTPSDVFEQVTLAVGYTEQLLKFFQVSNRIPDAPAFVPNKTPADVYQRLVACIRLLRAIAKESNVKMLNIQESKDRLHQAIPGNAYSLSKIILAEVRYFNTLLPQKMAAIQSYYAGYKVPADVYQRAGILFSQLTQLQNKVKKNNQWLRQGKKAGAMT